MASITETARSFSQVCETGKGLAACATGTERHDATASALFTGTHLTGGPCPPPGKTAQADHVDVMQFEARRSST